MNDEIQMVPIDQIRIINPRRRDRAKFEQLVESIKTLGLKKPVQVSVRSKEENCSPGYDLICGQGRLEAFKLLNFIEIPAQIRQVPREERLLRSLVENMARRFPATFDLIQEIQRLKGEGYSNAQISGKLGINQTTVGGLITLCEAGEERLMEATLKGAVPIGVAIEIAKADTIENQNALLQAYQKKQLNKNSIRIVKNLITHRRILGKDRTGPGKRTPTKASADGMVNAYKRETQRQKLLIRKANICESKLLFLVIAFKKLLGDENFINLLKAEGLGTIPKYLSDKLPPTSGEIV